MLKRIGIGLGVVFTLLIAAAGYFIYVPKPTLPDAAVAALTLEHDGLTRTYAVFVPTNLQPGASVLFALHPSRSSAEQMRRISGHALERIAEQTGFGSSINLRRLFEKQLHLTPGEYRQRFHCRKMA